MLTEVSDDAIRYRRLVLRLAIGTLANVLWDDGVIEVAPTIGEFASYKVSVVFDDGDGEPATNNRPHSTASGGYRAKRTVQLKARTTGTAAPTDGTGILNVVTVRVVAENGYNDEVYVFSVNRGLPADHGLTSLLVNGARSFADGSAYAFTPTTFDAATLTYSVDDVAPIASTAPASVFVRVGTQALQQGIKVVAYDRLGTGRTVLNPVVAINADGDLERVYVVPVHRTEAFDKNVDMTVISEDGVEQTYVLRLRRP